MEERKDKMRIKFTDGEIVKIYIGLLTKHRDILQDTNTEWQERKGLLNDYLKLEKKVGKYIAKIFGEENVWELSNFLY